MSLPATPAQDFARAHGWATRRARARASLLSLAWVHLFDHEWTEPAALSVPDPILRFLHPEFYPNRVSTQSQANP